MAVPSVHNSPTTGTQSLQQSHKNTAQPQGGTGQTHNATQATHTNATQQTQQTQAQTAQAPKPVVNGQGQKTGQVLNTTA